MNDKKSDLIALALSQVGVQESGGDNSGDIVEMYQRVIGKAEKEPWCVSFVQWCVREIDKKHQSKTVLFPTESSQMLWLRSPVEARRTDPSPGMIVVWTKFLNGLPTSLGHVGIVREVLGSGFMITIEGNTSPGDGVNREGDGVYLKRRATKQNTGSMRVCGFLDPW